MKFMKSFSSSDFRMNFMVYSCIILALIGFSFAINWEPDNDLQGTILQPFRKAHVLDLIHPMTFKFDIRPLKFFEHNKQKISKHCPNETLEVELFNSALEDLNAEWMQYTYYKLNGAQEIVETPTVLKELKQMQDKYQTDCSLLRNINSLILEANNKLNAVARLNVNALDYFIDLGEFHRTAKTLIEYFGNKYTVPFNHHLFSIEFWKHIQIHFLYKDDYIFIEIDIPFYTGNVLDLFIVRPKPMIWTGQPYLYNISRQYAIVDRVQPILYSETELYTYCKLSLNTMFCKWDTNLKNTCFDVVFAINGRKFDSNCFKSIKTRNMITQIGQNVYFTIFTPLQVWVERFKFKYSTTLPYSMKIIPPIESNLSTNFFHYNTENSDIYDIFYETQPVFENFFLQMNGGDQLKFMGLLLLCLSIIALIIFSKELGQQFLLFIALKNEILEKALRKEQFNVA